jgi:hypothetical protein
MVGSKTTLNAPMKRPPQMNCVNGLGFFPVPSYMETQLPKTCLTILSQLMNHGDTQMTRSNNYKPFMAYLEPKDYLRLKKFAKESKVSMTQILREAVTQRMASKNLYASGFNDGVEGCIASVNDLPAAQMRFPSGKSFAELVEEELLTKKITEAQDEEARVIA